MKKFLIIMFMSSLLLPVANAEENDVTDTGVTETDTVTETGAGLTPDNPFYFIDKAIEKLDLALTFDDATKTEKLLDYAKERLAEAEDMTEEEKTKFVEELVLEYANNLDEASDNLVELTEEESEQLEALLDETISESDELSDKLDVDLAEKLEERKGTAYIKFSVLKDALNASDQDLVIEKANEAGFGLGDLSKIAVGAEMLGITLEEALTGVIEAGNVETYFASNNIKVNELIIKGVELKQEKIQQKLATAIENADDKAVARLEKQLQKSIDVEAKQALKEEYKNKKEEILNQLNVEDLDDLTEEEKTQVKDQLKELKDETKNDVKAIVQEKKDKVSEAVKEVKEHKADKEELDALKETVTDDIKDKVKEKVQEKANARANEKSNGKK